MTKLLSVGRTARLPLIALTAMAAVTFQARAETGVIQSVDGRHKTVTIIPTLRRHIPECYLLHRHCELTVNGDAARLAELRPGLFVHFDFDAFSDSLLSLACKDPSRQPPVPARTVRGRIDSVQPTWNQLAVAPRNADTLRLRVLKSTTIQVNGVDTELADLPPGLDVEVVFQPVGRKLISVRAFTRAYKEREHQYQAVVRSWKEAR